MEFESSLWLNLVLGTIDAHSVTHKNFSTSIEWYGQLRRQGAITGSTRGGPSGELGHMQFLSGNWMQFGVDANGDGKRDPYDVVDALASAANMLRANGWKAGQPFGPGTANFQVLSAWNDSGNYQRAIAYAAERVGP